MVNRRDLLKYTGGSLGLGGLFGSAGLSAFATESVKLPFANGERPLVVYPGKRPLLGLTARPPQLETPFSVFNDGLLTPNDAFFVRYHLADIPLEIDPETYRLEIKGHVEKTLSLSLRELKEGFEPIELVAVNQCSGNSRGFSNPRVAGGQLGNGAMGNACWKGVSLKALLDKAGIKPSALQVSFNGLDRPVLEETPDYIKALDIDHVRDGEVMLAYSMNGEDLPWLNGFPLRLVVPGFFGTYWVKHVNEINVLDQQYNGFWMKSAYRIPSQACACVEPGQKSPVTIPINRLAIRSFLTNINDGAHVQAGVKVPLRGIAFDGGYGIHEVDVSQDEGQTWHKAELGEDVGKYSFREWKTALTFKKGEHVILVRASNRIGQSQPLEALWNPAGYMRNVVEKTRLVAA